MWKRERQPKFWIHINIVFVTTAGKPARSNFKLQRNCYFDTVRLHNQEVAEFVYKFPLMAPFLPLPASSPILKPVCSRRCIGYTVYFLPYVFCRGWGQTVSTDELMIFLSTIVLPSGSPSNILEYRILAVATCCWFDHHNLIVHCQIFHAMTSWTPVLQSFSKCRILKASN